MSDIYCGIDVGTTNLKVLLLDDAGQSIWVKSVPAPHLNDGLGIVTDARALLQYTEDLIIAGWTAVGKGRRIRAISSGGIGEDGVCIDGNFNPLGHAIQWNDRRGEMFASELAATDFAKAYPAILLDFSSTAGKWQWLQLNKPTELRNAASWITMTDWPIACWSGVAFMSATLAPRTGCYDVFTRSWLAPFLDYAQAPPLPKLVEAGGIVGTMNHSRLNSLGITDTNTLLVAGGHDHPIAASAIRRSDPHARIDSMGTANATYGETQSLDPDHDLKGLYVTLPVSGAAKAAVIGMTEFSKTLAEHVSDLAQFYADMLTCRDEMHIPSRPRNALHKLAQRTHDYWHAVTEAGVPEAPIHATGGWARCPAVMQMRANVFQKTITVIDEEELVALGAALYAAEAAGAIFPGSITFKSHRINPRNA
jgi:xylulokinase